MYFTCLGAFLASKNTTYELSDFLIYPGGAFLPQRQVLFFYEHHRMLIFS